MNSHICLFGISLYRYNRFTIVNSVGFCACGLTNTPLMAAEEEGVKPTLLPLLRYYPSPLAIHLYTPSLSAPLPPPTVRILPSTSAFICGSATSLKFLDLGFSNSYLSISRSSTLTRATPPYSSASPLPSATSPISIRPARAGMCRTRSNAGAASCRLLRCLPPLLRVS